MNKYILLIGLVACINCGGSESDGGDDSSSDTGSSSSTSSGDTSTSTGSGKTSTPASKSMLYGACKSDADCDSGLYCPDDGFCTESCSVMGGGLNEYEPSSTCGSGKCLIFDTSAVPSGACVPCANYFDDDGKAVGCSDQSPGDKGDACAEESGCKSGLHCIHSKCSDGCRDDYDCRGDLQVCRNNRCDEVQCKDDSDCGECSRCDSNECYSCGYGPYGCYC